MDTVSTETPPFALPALHAEVQAQAKVLASRYAERHREIRLHPFEHGGASSGAVGRGQRARACLGRIVPSGARRQRGRLCSLILSRWRRSRRGNLILWMPVLSAAIGDAIAKVGPKQRARTSGRPGSPRVKDVFFCARGRRARGRQNALASQTTVRQDGDHFPSTAEGRRPRGSISPNGRRRRAHPGGDAETPRSRRARRPGAPGTEREERPTGSGGARAVPAHVQRTSRRRSTGSSERGSGACSALGRSPDVERLMTAALCIGKRATALDRALQRAERAHDLRQAADRRRAGDPAPARPLCTPASATRLLVYRAAARFDQGGDARRSQPGKMAKVLTPIAVRRSRSCDEMLGAGGAGRARGHDRSLP